MFKAMFKEVLHKKMVKLEKRLRWLASLYFDEKITIMYLKGTPKVTKQN